MTTSTRFAAAVHLLALIAAEKPSAVTSGRLAARLDANPAAARRILGKLAAAGITAGRLGKGGGAVLARPAKKITLLDIYRAVENPGLIGRRRSMPDAAGERMAEAFDETVSACERAFFEALGAVTLKGFLKAAKTSKGS